MRLSQRDSRYAVLQNATSEAESSMLAARGALCSLGGCEDALLGCALFLTCALRKPMSYSGLTQASSAPSASTAD